MAAQAILSLKATPGYPFQADVQYKGVGEYSFFLRNLSNNKYANVTKKSGPSADENVAEFIVERTEGKNLFTFGNINMQGYTDNVALQEWKAQAIPLYDKYNGKEELLAAPGGIRFKAEFTEKYYSCHAAETKSKRKAGTEGVAPTASDSAATSVTSTTATLHGSVNPNGGATGDHFEYGTEAENYSASTPEGSAGEGEASVAVEQSLTGLRPGTTYHFRIVANSSGGTTAGEDRTFTTSGAPPPPPPTVTTEGVSGLEGHSATLEATVNPNGLDSHYYFEYGTTSAQYDSVAPALPGSDAGAGTTPVHVSVGLTGLTPYVTYYYRVVASSSSGTSYGGQKEFKLPVAGQTKFELDASTYFDEGEHGYGTEANAPWVKEHVGLLLGYPSYANKYIGWYHVPTFAYLDQKTEQKEHSFTNEQYVNAVEAQAAVGYTGAFVADANWEATNEGPSQTPESIATLLEELHTKIPGLQIEINSQYHEIWPLIKAKKHVRAAGAGGGQWR